MVRVLLTVEETADLLRTTRKAVYALIERRQIPGVTSPPPIDSFYVRFR
jgi:hypothetical protein